MSIAFLSLILLQYYINVACTTDRHTSEHSLLKTIWYICNEKVTLNIHVYYIPGMNFLSFCSEIVFLC